MQYKRLGKTDLSVSRIALGTMQFCWTTTEQEAYQVLDTYIDAGGNFFDTADMYAQYVPGLKGGEVETIIGKWMKKRNNRERIVLTTKVRSRMWEGRDGEGLSRKHILRACEESLKRLQTDYIDLYLSHWPDENTPIEETLSAYATLTKQGKVRFIGCSNYSAIDVETALSLGKTLGAQYACLQACYNLLSRKEVEDNVRPIITKHVLALTVYSPLAGGFLTGDYQKGLPLPNHARAKYIESLMTEKNLVILNTLKEIARQYSVATSQVALAWLLQKPYITSVITGADSPEQIKENIKSVEVLLSRFDLERLDACSHIA